MFGLHYRIKCDMIKVPNYILNISSLIAKVCIFLCKNAGSIFAYLCYVNIFKISLATIGAVFFWRMTSVVRLFYYIIYEEELT